MRFGSREFEERDDFSACGCKTELRQEIETLTSEFLAKGGVIQKLSPDKVGVYIDVYAVSVLLHTTINGVKKLVTHGKMPKPDTFTSIPDNRKGSCNTKIDWNSPILWEKSRILTFQGSEDWAAIKKRYKR